MSHTRFLFRSSVMVMALNGVSRLTGFVKLLLMTRTFGIGDAADAYAAANQLPELLFAMLAGGAVAAAFIPVYTGILARRDAEPAARFANTIVALTVMALGGLGLVVIVGAPWITTHLLTPGFSSAQQALTAHLVQVLMVATFFFAVGSIYASILQAHDHFFAPAMGGILIDLGQIVGIALLAPQLGIASAAWGLTGGAVMILAVQAPFLWRLGLDNRPTLALRTEGINEMVHLFWPRLVTMGAGQAVDLVVVRLASGLAPGSMSAYFYAVLIMAYMPRGLFAQAIATVIFPTMARQYNSGDLTGLQATTTAGLRATLALVIPAAVGIMALGLPGMRFLFPGEELDGAALTLVFTLTAILSVRLISDASVDILSLAFYARHNTRLPMVANVVWMATVLGLSYVLVTPLGIYGLAWASALAGLGLMLALLVVVWRSHHGIDGRSLALTVGRAVMAAAAMVVAVRLLSRIHLPEMSFVIVGIMGGAAVYVSVYAALGGRELLTLLRRTGA
ncbi:MAG TPA: murein biosynthesis integral membrane protein MurJ [Chloroflexi bacterium]|nr:murein biosynthesis integral membrane protein MurJ [Chloroflexota bacterium]